MGEWLDKNDIAKMLGVSTRTIDRLMADNKIPYYKSGESRPCRVKFNKKDVERYIKKNLKGRK